MPGGQGSGRTRMRMRWTVTTAIGVLAGAVAAVPILGEAAPAAPAEGAEEASAISADLRHSGPTPDRAARTPVARPGTRAAATSSLSPSALRSRLDAAMRSAGGSSGAWVFHIGAAGNPVLYARNARSGRILASNQKLFSTAAALERFGADHRFRTSVFARGQRKGADRRVLNGDLVIRGDGDPALAGGSFARSRGLPLTPIGDLARSIDDAGIRRVTGRVRADDSIFDRRRGIPATGYRPSPWLSPLSGLSFNSGHGSSGYASSPELEAARTLRRALVKRGIRIAGGVGRTSLRNRFVNGNRPIAVVRSPRLSSLAAATNKPSNNFFAEMLLKRLGGGGKAKGTTRRGARRVQRFARSLGTSVRASDGSGLGRSNRATPRQVGQLLRAMTRADSRQAFRASLAIAGRDGTLAGRMRGTAAEGRCRGKTGTLTGVSSLSGYCNIGGSQVVFSILMNGVDSTRARSAQDRMAAAIARYGG